MSITLQCSIEVEDGLTYSKSEPRPYRGGVHGNSSWFWVKYKHLYVTIHLTKGLNIHK